ncbi:MAG: hypothetical protein ACRC10_08020 [Thermoguttaceae bacterium]
MSNTTDNTEPIRENSATPHPKTRGLLGCLKKCLISGVLMLLLGTLLFFTFGINYRSLQISKETTYVTGPLRADGKRIDYFRACEELLYPAEMKTENNGYRLLIEYFGDLEANNRGTYENDTYTECDPIILEQYHTQICEKLGLDPKIPPKCDIPLEKWCVNYFLSDRIRKSADKEEEENELFAVWVRLEKDCWTLDDYPYMKDWLDNVDQPLTIVEQAVRKPVFCIPMLRLDDSPHYWFEARSCCRNIATTLQIRANYRLGMGDIDGAIDDKISILRLGRAIGQGTLIDFLLGKGIESSGWAIPVEGNPDYPVSDEQWTRLQREMDALPQPPNRAETFECEHFLYLDYFQDVLSGTVAPDFGITNPTVLQFLSRLVDPNIVLREFNRWYEKHITDLNISDSEEEETFWKKDQSRLWNPLTYLTVRGRSEVFCDYLINSSDLERLYRGTGEIQNRYQCAEHLTRLTIALRRYELEHGTLPDGNWRVAILPYLGEKGEEYFQCPDTRLNKGETTYMLLRSENGNTPKSFFLVEVKTPQKWDEGLGLIEIPDNNQETRKENGFSLKAIEDCITDCQIIRRNGSVQRKRWLEFSDARLDETSDETSAECPVDVVEETQGTAYEEADNENQDSGQ